MKIFLSWSGERSKYIAENLSNWLEQVLQAAEPWISTDIEKGKRWSQEISQKLEESKVAIICLTNDNLDSNWVHFEAGAIAKNKEAFVCTFLYEVNPTNVQQPLSQFQNTKFLKADVLKLIKSINTIIGNSGGKALKDHNLSSVFDTFWPQLESKLKEVPPETHGEVNRTDRQLLEESLQLLRGLKNNRSEISLSSKMVNEHLDYFVRRYAEEYGLDYSQPGMKGHEVRCAKYMLQFPDTMSHFKSDVDLIEKIRDKIGDLLPF